MGKLPQLGGVAVAEERMRVNRYGQRNVREAADAIGRGGGAFKLRSFATAYAADSHAAISKPQTFTMHWLNETRITYAPHLTSSVGSSPEMGWAGWLVGQPRGDRP
jgi:hypothetical protein